MLHNLQNTYLIKRSNTYYFRYRIPENIRASIGKHEIYKSLCTNDSLTALKRSLPLFELVSKIKQAKQLINLDPSTYSKILSEVKKYLAENYKMVKPYDVKALDERIEDLRYHIDVMHKQSLVGSGMISDHIGRQAMVPMSLYKILKSLQVSFDDESDVFLDLEQEYEDKISLSYLRRELAHLTGKAPTKLIAESETSVITFSALLDKFIEVKTAAKVTQKMLGQYKTQFALVKEILVREGLDLPIDQIMKKHIKMLIQAYLKTPVRNKSPYNKMSPKEIMDMVEAEQVNEEHFVTERTASDMLKTMQGVFVVAINDDLLKDSPARDLKLKLDTSNRYGNYSDTELKLYSAFILNQETDISKKWIVLLSMYHGMRLGEVCQLRKQDIKLDADSSRHYIHVNPDAGSVKTEAGIRTVPIHKYILDLGFLDFVNNSDEVLFPRWKDSKRITQWFSDLRDKLNIPKYDDYGNRRVFHSLRHSFITKSRSADTPILSLQQVVGHEKINAGQTDRYTHNLPLKDLLIVVDNFIL